MHGASSFILTVTYISMKRHQLYILCFILICIGFRPLNGQIIINELCSVNETIITDEFGESTDWLELYNEGESAVNLEGWYLSEDDDDPFKWQFPSVTIGAKGYLLLFASGNDLVDQYIHTNFRLSSKGEELLLWNANQELVQRLLFPPIPEDLSYGVSGAEYLFFNSPTPNDSNAVNDIISTSASPNMIQEEFFYSTPTSIDLTCTTPGCTIYFSRDGSKPNENGELYTGPIQIDTTTSIRAISIAPDYIDSAVESYTIFIGADHDLPIVSLNAEPEEYYSIESGILVDGLNGEPNFPFFGSNYWSNREVETNFEFFENGNRVINQLVDSRVHGGTNARTKPQKPLRLLAKEKYGDRFIDYPMFEERENTQHKRLVLRNASGDFNTCQLRDAFISRYISNSEFSNVPIYLDELAHRPAAMYVNGAYYGMINIREKSDEHYIANLYGLDKENLDVLEEDTFIVQGDFVIFDEMYDFVISNDLSIQTNYEQAASMFDVLNIADYFIVQTGLNNNDFGGNNIKYWRERKEGAKWRYILFDLDLALGLRVWSRYDVDLFLEKMTKYEGTNRHINILQAFLENEGFRNYFLNRHGDLFSTVFQTDIFQEELRTSELEIDQEVRKHYERWPSTSYEEWQEVSLPVMYNHIERRPAFAHQFLIDFFGLNKTVDLGLESNPSIGGKIRINSITPEVLPWQGTYFDGVPVRLTAEPALGYRFSHWESSAGTLDNNTSFFIEVNFEQAENITAHYIQLTDSEPFIESVWWDGQNVNARIGISESSDFEFTVYDVLGRVVSTAAPTFFEPGSYTQQLSLNSVGTGVYFLSIRDDSQEVSTSFFVNN